MTSAADPRLIQLILKKIRAMAAMAKLISSTMLEIHGQQLSEDSIGVMQGSMAPWLRAQGFELNANF